MRPAVPPWSGAGTSLAMTAKPRRCSSARRFHGRVQRKNVGLKRDAFEDAGDFGNVGRAGAGIGHRLHHLADHGAGFVRHFRCVSSLRAGLLHVLRVPFHGRGQRFHAGDGLLQRSSLLLSARQSLVTTVGCPQADPRYCSDDCPVQRRRLSGPRRIYRCNNGAAVQQIKMRPCPAMQIVGHGFFLARLDGRMRSALSRGDEIGKHSGLNNLSARPETADVEPFKFGEPPGA